MMTTTTSTKGVKVTDSERKSRVGIAAKTLDDVRKKTVEKFKLKSNDIYFQCQDGTVIDSDEYFETLPPQSLLIWVRNGERAETDAEILYKTIREVNDEYLSAGEKVQEFFTEKMKSKVFKLAEVLKGIDDDRTKLSLRCDDPEWFKGLDTNAKTKEDYMFRRAQDRFRTYFYKTREELLKRTDVSSKTSLTHLLHHLRSRLAESKFNGSYFDRRSRRRTSRTSERRVVVSLCNDNGDFYCQGRWDKSKCLYNRQHMINPYSSRESRIVFQTWNLDHGVERSRSIIPAICDALTASSNPSSIDCEAIYDDLFTVKNLKFVHIVCHDKGAHLNNNNDKILSYLMISN